MRRIARDAALVMTAKLVAMALCAWSGFRAVSDDDYARVVIAQAQALDAKLDPTGTSWLPAPFWVLGGVLAVFGRDLAVARGASLTFGLASAVVVFAAARRLATTERGALAGALLAAVFPWSARLGIATVPELPVAALALYALSTLGGTRGSSDARARFVGGAALAVATLSRYETWCLAAGFAAFTARDVISARAMGAGRVARAHAVAALVPLAGPFAWCVHNARSHGSALHFVDRVAAYRRAVGGTEAPLAERLFAYPAAMVRHEPELTGAALVALIATLHLWRDASRPPDAGSGARGFSAYSRPFVLCLAQLALLAAAIAKDGGPTHHPERALLVLMLLLAVFTGDAVVFAWPRLGRGAIAACAVAVAGVVALSLSVVRPWYRLEDFAARESEEAVGLAVRDILPPEARVLVEVEDYSFYATLAASGRPEMFVLDRDFHPSRESRSSFRSVELLAAKLRETGARAIVGRASGAASRLCAELLVRAGEVALFAKCSP